MTATMKKRKSSSIPKGERLTRQQQARLQPGGRFASGPKVHRYERELEAIWDSLFSSPVHLDSALSKQPPAARELLAPILPRLMAAPLGLATRLALPLREGEPWSLTRARLAIWHGPREIIRRLMQQTGGDPKEIEVRLRDVVGGEGDFPPHWLGEVGLTFGMQAVPNLARTLAAIPPMTIRCARSVDRLEVAAALEKETGVAFSPTPLSPAGLTSDRFARILNTERFKRGEFEIQDEGSQAMAWFAMWPEKLAPALTKVPGERRSGSGMNVEWPAEVREQVWIDACAGAGGKTLALADAMRGRGRVYAYDVSEKKLQALKRRASRAGLRNIQAVRVKDVSRDEDALTSLAKFKESADGVLVDSPCSGWGVLRRNPDIKWRQTPEELQRLPDLQLKLLLHYSTLVKPGGRLIYGVCTFRRAETTEVVERFLKQAPRFRAGPGGYLGPGPMDGFFMQCFEAQGSTA